MRWLAFELNDTTTLTTGIETKVEVAIARMPNVPRRTAQGSPTLGSRG